MRLLPVVLRNVLRKRTRTALTVASIVLPLLVVCIMGAFLEALDRPDPAATRGMFRIVTRHRVSLTNTVPLSHAERIRALPGVVAVTKFIWFGGVYRDRSAVNFFPRMAVEPATFLQVFDDARLLEGTTADWLSDRAGCIAGKMSADRYGWKLGDRITLVGDAYPVTLELTIRGIYQQPDGNARTVFFDRTYLEEAHPPAAGTTGAIWTKVSGAAAAQRLPAEIDALFENSPFPTKTDTEKAFQMSFVELLGNVKLLLGSVGTLIVVVLVLIAANTMAMSARERVTEIAVLRTLGFQRRTVLGMVLAEGLLLGALGGLGGTGLYLALLPALKAGLGRSPMGGLAASLSASPGLLALALAISVGVGLAAGLVPALRASSRPIVEGLRQVA